MSQLYGNDTNIKDAIFGIFKHCSEKVKHAVSIGQRSIDCVRNQHLPASKNSLNPTSILGGHSIWQRTATFP